MARLITELTAAGAVTPASDLLWIEQSSAPRKITVNDLVSAGTPASHTHPASDVVSGVLNVARISGTRESVSAKISMPQFNRWASDQDMGGTTNWEEGIYGGYNTMTNGPTGMTYDPFLVMGSASDVRSFLVVPRTASRAIAYKGSSSSGASHTAWHYAGWTTTAADADLDSSFLKLSGGTMTGVITGDDNSLGSLTAPGSGSIIRQGSYVTVSRLYSNAAFAIACNAYSDPADTVSGQMRYTNTHGSYGHTIFEGSGGEFRWYCASGATTAGAVISKSLKMSLSAAGRLSNAERIYPDGNATGYIDSPTLRGSINVAGNEAGSYAGYAINNVMTFMDNGTSTGIYEADNHWRIAFNRNEDNVGLYNGSVRECQSRNSNATDGHSGFEALDYGQTMRQVGFVDMEEVTFAVNTIVGRDHWHKALVHTSGTTHNLTFNTAGDVLNGVVLWVKARSGPCVLVDGTMVLSLYDGGAAVPPTGNISIARAGWATVHKTGDSTADVTGVGLS